MKYITKIQTTRTIAAYSNPCSGFQTPQAVNTPLSLLTKTLSTSYRNSAARLRETFDRLSEVRCNLRETSDSLSEVRCNLRETSDSLSEVRCNLRETSDSLSEVRCNLRETSDRLSAVRRKQKAAGRKQKAAGGTPSSQLSTLNSQLIMTYRASVIARHEAIRRSFPFRIASFLPMTDVSSKPLAGFKTTARVLGPLVPSSPRPLVPLIFNS
jgi:septal ring factor EnvC (AmiA/AmiB activator)